MINLERIPYRPLKRLLRVVRIRYYTVDWPEDAPSITIEDDPEGFETVLRNWYGFEGLLLSYHYDGEAVNLRRPEVIGHVEPSRYEHKTAHIEGDGLRWLDEAELESALVAYGLEDGEGPGKGGHAD